MKPGALTRHMRQLRQAGLIATVPDVDQTRDDQPLYVLDVAAVQRAKRAFFAPFAHTLPADNDAKTLAVFVHDNRIRHMPTHSAKLRVVLAWPAAQFETERVYSEADVNHVSAATTRISRCGGVIWWTRGWPVRDRGIYRRVDRS